MGGETQLVVATTVGLLPHVRAGKLKAIALTSAKRSAAAPDIPTFAESVLPGCEHEPWNGSFRPAGLPKPLLARVNAEVARILQTPDMRKIFEQEGADVVGSSRRRLRLDPEGGIIAKWDEGRHRGGNQSRVRHRPVCRTLNQPTPGALTRPRRKA